MEQGAQTERVKKKVGRPKGTGLFTEEENKERARQRAILYYSLNFEKERERTRIDSQAKRMLFNMFVFFIFLISIYTIDNLIIY